MVQTLDLFICIKHDLIDVYWPTFGAPHESKISDVIDIVEYEFAQHQKTLQSVIQNLTNQGKAKEADWFQQNLRSLVDSFSQMSSSFLARQILDTTHTFRVNKTGILMERK